MMANDRVERPATMPMPRPDAAHYASRSASNALLCSILDLNPHDIKTLGHFIVWQGVPRKCIFEDLDSCPGFRAAEMSHRAERCVRVVAQLGIAAVK